MTASICLTFLWGDGALLTGTFEVLEGYLEVQVCPATACPDEGTPMYRTARIM
jgi:hypothetical protein